MNTPPKQTFSPLPDLELNTSTVPLQGWIANLPEHMLDDNASLFAYQDDLLAVEALTTKYTQEITAHSAAREESETERENATRLVNCLNFIDSLGTLLSEQLHAHYFSKNEDINSCFFPTPPVPRLMVVHSVSEIGSDNMPLHEYVQKYSEHFPQHATKPGIIDLPLDILRVWCGDQTTSPNTHYLVLPNSLMFFNTMTCQRVISLIQKTIYLRTDAEKDSHVQ